MTRYEESGGQLVRVVDDLGSIWAELAWESDRLVSLWVPSTRVDGAVIHDPLLGPAHAVTGTTMSALDWARPTEIPAIAAPGQLPPGAGGAVMNVIALLAARAGIAALRYAGPFPTRALWRTLARSFRTSGTEAAFTAGALDRMLRLAREPIAIDFAPAPHDRRSLMTPLGNLPLVPRGHVEVRADRVERAVIDGVAYEPDGSPARLVDGRCELWFGDTRYAHVATVASDGAFVDGPRPIPSCTSDVIGKPFPPALVAAIAELVADAVPAPLAADVQRWLAARSIRWADLGARTAALAGDDVTVHAAIWQHVQGMQRLALALAEAIAPVATLAVIASLTPKR